MEELEETLEEFLKEFVEYSLEKKPGFLEVISQKIVSVISSGVPGTEFCLNLQIFCGVAKNISRWYRWRNS